MAHTKIWPVTHDLPFCVNYAMSPEKTWDGKKFLHSGIWLDVSSSKRVVDQMMATKRRWNKTGGRLAYHAEQSFKPGEVTPDQAHEIGVKLAQEVWGDRFEVLVTTHLDQDHIHNHFIINSVSIVDGKKYHESNRDYHKILRATSDRLCKEYGLSTIERPQNTRTKAWPEINPEGSSPTIHTLMYQDMDNALQVSNDLDEFYHTLEHMGYEVKRFTAEGKPLAHPAIRPPTPEGREPCGFFRLYKFAPGYTEEDIIKRLDSRAAGVEDQGKHLIFHSSPVETEPPKDQGRETQRHEDMQKDAKAYHPKSAVSSQHTARNISRAQQKADYWNKLNPLIRPRLRIGGGVLYLYSGVWLPQSIVMWRRMLYYSYLLRRMNWTGLRWTYTKVAFILKSVERTSYPKYPKMDLRRELHRLHQYSEEALLLHQHKIDTMPQLQARLAMVNDTIHTINIRRKQLRYQIKSAETAEETEPLRQELQKLNESVAPLYHERALLKDIMERSQAMERIVEQEQTEAQMSAAKQGKGECPEEKPKVSEEPEPSESEENEERKEKYEL